MKPWGHNRHKITLAPFVSQADYTTDQERLTPAQWLRLLRYRACFDSKADDMARRMDERAQALMDAQAYMVKMDQTGKPEYDWQDMEQERQDCERTIRKAVILERHLAKLRPIVTERRERQARVNGLWAELADYYRGQIKTRHAPGKENQTGVEAKHTEAINKRIAAYRRAAGKRLPLTERTEGAFLVLAHARGHARFKVASGRED